MNKTIQLFRGIAIIAVIAIHTYGGERAKGYGVAIRPFINFAVGVFFFLSGYLTKEQTGHGYKQMIYKRIRKVLIPYLTWSIIFSVLMGKMSTFIPDLLLAKCNGIYYFIFVYIQMAILTPATFWLWNSRYQLVGWLITPVTIIAVRYVCVLLGISVGFPLQGELFAFWYIFYYLGIGLGNKKIKLQWTKSKILIFYIISIVFQEIEGYMWYFLGNYDLATTQLKLSAIVSSTLFCLLIYSYIRSSEYLNTVEEGSFSKSMAYIGDFSFGIYLCHKIMVEVVRRIPVPIINTFPINTSFVLILSLVAVVLGKKILGKYAYIFGL